MRLRGYLARLNNECAEYAYRVAVVEIPLLFQPRMSDEAWAAYRAFKLWDNRVHGRSTTRFFREGMYPLTAEEFRRLERTFMRFYVRGGFTFLPRTPRHTVRKKGQ